MKKKYVLPLVTLAVILYAKNSKAGSKVSFDLETKKSQVLTMRLCDLEAKRAQMLSGIDTLTFVNDFPTETSQKRNYFPQFIGVGQVDKKEFSIDNIIGAMYTLPEYNTILQCQMGHTQIVIAGYKVKEIGRFNGIEVIPLNSTQAEDMTKKVIKQFGLTGIVVSYPPRYDQFNDVIEAEKRLRQ